MLDAPGRLERIGLHLDAEALDAAALEAHSLRGAAGTLRLEQLATQAERLELAVRDGDAAAARELLGGIKAIVAGLEAERGASPGGAVATTKRCTVLLVEDNPVNVLLVERVLARRPAVRLLTATHAETAVLLARAERPDLVLLDLHLPDASGREVLARLRSDPATAGIPVVVVSADTPDRDELRGLGVRECLTKPIDVGRLLELVDELDPEAAP